MRFGGVGAGQHPFAERSMGGHHRILFEQHDSAAGDDRALALVGVDDPGDAFQQGRLARAVAPDQRQPVTRADVDVEVPEQPAFALNETEVFIGKNWGSHARPLEPDRLRWKRFTLPLSA
jgi:hypothetical protein